LDLNGIGKASHPYINGMLSKDDEATNEFEAQPQQNTSQKPWWMGTADVIKPTTNF
jgi:hypothetical protein